MTVTTDKPIEGEVVEESRALVKVPEERALIAMFDPAEVIERASRQATALADIVEKRHLYSQIQNRKHVNVEGWQTLGALNGLFGLYCRLVRGNQVQAGLLVASEALYVLVELVSDRNQLGCRQKLAGWPVRRRLGRSHDAMAPA